MFTLASKESVTSARLNMRRLFLLRSIGIVGQILVIVIATKWLKFTLPLMALTAILVTLTLWNTIVWWRLRLPHPIHDTEFFLHLTVDVIALGGILFFTGGATNPFAWFFLLPLMIAAAVLPKLFVWLMAALTIGCYSLLMIYYIPIETMHHSAHGEFQQHVIGMWSGFVLSALMVAYFVTDMAGTLRDRDRVLAQAREQRLRDERLVALGTLAAGVAHELGTPLGTMAIVTSDLEQDYPAAKDAQLNQKLNIIKNQISRCKQALSTISASAGEIRAESGELKPVEQYLDNLIREWQQRRPDVQLHSSLSRNCPPANLIAEQTLTQALTNILDNAADVSPQWVEIKGHWNQTELIIEINDNGPGLSQEASESLGKKPFSTKQQGLGLGLFLAHTVIERLGGNVTLYNRETGGVCTRVTLPLAVTQLS
ncbi:MAG: ATP-binding protein [Gammaproteobacteria bacterium]|nr:ATP-binding protein [Gammaproteobacteria bacterium]